MAPATYYHPLKVPHWASAKTKDLPICRDAISPISLIIYIKAFPVIFGWIVDFDGFGSFLLGGVPSKDVDFAFEDEGEAGGAGGTHGRQVSPFF